MTITNTPMIFPTEYGWNTDPTCVIQLRSGVRLNCAKGSARIKTDAPVYLPGRSITIEIRGAPAIDPRVDKGAWIMFCDHLGKETQQEFDLLELSRFGNPHNQTGWINYHEVSGKSGIEMNGFDAGACDNYMIEATFSIVDKGLMMVCAIQGGDNYIFSHSFVKDVPHYGNLKIGCFAILNEHKVPEFAFDRVADRGPLFMDVTRVEIERITK